MSSYRPIDNIRPKHMGGMFCITRHIDQPGITETVPVATVRREDVLEDMHDGAMSNSNAKLGQETTIKSKKGRFGNSSRLCQPNKQDSILLKVLLDVLRTKSRYTSHGHGAYVQVEKLKVPELAGRSAEALRKLFLRHVEPTLDKYELSVSDKALLTKCQRHKFVSYFTEHRPVVCQGHDTKCNN